MQAQGPGRILIEDSGSGPGRILIEDSGSDSQKTEIYDSDSDYSEPLVHRYHSWSSDSDSAPPLPQPDMRHRPFHIEGQFVLPTAIAAVHNLIVALYPFVWNHTIEAGAQRRILNAARKIQKTFESIVKQIMVEATEYHFSVPDFNFLFKEAVRRYSVPLPEKLAQAQDLADQLWEEVEASDFGEYTKSFVPGKLLRAAKASMLSFEKRVLAITKAAYADNVRKVSLLGRRVALQADEAKLDDEMKHDGVHCSYSKSSFKDALLAECHKNNHDMCALDRFQAFGVPTLDCCRLEREACGPACQDPFENPVIGSLPHQAAHLTSLGQLARLAPVATAHCRAWRPGFTLAPLGCRAWSRSKTSQMLKLDQKVGIAPGESFNERGERNDELHVLTCSKLLCTSGLLAGLAFHGGVRILSYASCRFGSTYPVCTECHFERIN